VASSGCCAFSLTNAGRAAPESHQRSWWFVHTQPTKETAAPLVPNPTNAVGGSFIPSLQERLPPRSSRIPPTQSVVRSYPAYKRDRRPALLKFPRRGWWFVHIQPAAAPLRKAFNRAVVNSPQVPA
jgi:hypothetical protein